MYIKMFYIKLLSLPHSELVVSLLLTVTTNLPQMYTYCTGCGLSANTFCRFICSIGGFKGENLSLLTMFLSVSNL